MGVNPLSCFPNEKTAERDESEDYALNWKMAYTESTHVRPYVRQQNGLHFNYRAYFKGSF